MKGNVIVVDGKRINVDGSIDMEVYSPFTDNTSVRMPSGSFINPKGNYTQQFNSRDKQLDVISGFAGALQSNAGVTKFEGVSLLSNGVFIDFGRFTVQKIQKDIDTRDNNYELTFFPDKGQFNKAVNGQKLTALQMDGQRNINDGGYCAANPRLIPGMGLENAPYPELYVDGTVSAPQPTDTIVNSLCIEYLLAFLKDLGSGYLYVALDQPEPGVMNLQVIADNAISPGPVGSGYNIFANFTITPVTGISLSIITDYANEINQAGDDYICFPMYGQMWDGAEDDSCMGFFNYTNGDDFNTIPAYLTQEFDNITSGVKFLNYIPCRNQIVPMYYYHQVLRHCFSEFGFTLQGDMLGDNDFQKLILPNVYSILQEQVYQLNNLNSANVCLNALYCQLPTTIIPANHLPDMLISDFVSDFCVRFQCQITISGTIATIKKLNLQKSDSSFDKVGKKVSVEYAANNTPGVNISYNTSSSDTSYAAGTGKNLQNILPTGPIKTDLLRSFDTVVSIPITLPDYGIVYIPIHKQAYIPSATVYKPLASAINLPVNIFEVPSHPVLDATSADIVAQIVNYYLLQIKKGNAQPDYFSAQPFYQQQYFLQKDTGEVWTIINILKQALPSLQLDWNYANIVSNLSAGASLVIASLSTAGSAKWPPQNVNNLLPYNTTTLKPNTSNQFQQFQLALTPVEMYEYGKKSWGTTMPFNLTAGNFPSGYTGQSFNGTVYPNKPFPQLTDTIAVFFYAGNVYTLNGDVVGGGIAVPPSLNMNLYANLGVPIYSTGGDYRGISGQFNFAGSQLVKPLHAYIAYTGSTPSFYSLQVYIANSLGVVDDYTTRCPDPIHAVRPTGSYEGGAGSLFVCPTNLNTPPAFNAGDIESKIALYHGYVPTMDITCNYMSFHNYAPNNIPEGSEPLNAWNLSLVGTEGLINQFWGPLVNVWAKNRKVTYQLPLTFTQIKNWDWTTAKVIRGVKYYVASIKFKLPDLLNGAFAEVECYEI